MMPYRTIDDANVGALVQQVDSKLGAAGPLSCVPATLVPNNSLRRSVQAHRLPRDDAEASTGKNYRRVGGQDACQPRESFQLHGLSSWRLLRLQELSVVRWPRPID